MCKVSFSGVTRGEHRSDDVCIFDAAIWRNKLIIEIGGSFPRVLEVRGHKCTKQPHCKYFMANYLTSEFDSLPNEPTVAYCNKRLLLWLPTC